MSDLAVESPIWLGNKRAPNRLVHLAMECNDAFNGLPSELTLRRYRRLAQAKAGITNVEATSVSSSSRARIHQLVTDEAHRKGIEQLTSEFKQINHDTILCYQITHSGQISDPRFSEVLRVYDLKGFDSTPGRLLETSEIGQIRDSFIRAAEIVHDSGADMVDVKLCHGYLGGQTIRPANTRIDEYGGSLENRMRFAREVVQGIKGKIPDPNFKIMARFSIYEGDATLNGEPVVGGVGTRGPESTEFDLEESHQILRMLAGYGVDILSISAGMPKYNGAKWVGLSKAPEEFNIDRPETYQAYHHFAFAKGAKELNLGIPVIASGFSIFGKSISKVGENVISHGYGDMLGIGRQSLADPDIERILSGNANYCVRCGGCRELLFAQMPLGCAWYDPFYTMMRDSVRLHTRTPEKPKK